MYIEKQRLFSKAPGPEKTAPVLNYQETYIPENYMSGSSYNVNSRVNSLRKNRRSAIAVLWGNGIVIQTSNKSSVSHNNPSNNIVRKSNGSPRFPNIQTPLLEFDSDKYICDDLSSSDCDRRTAEFKELLLKEFHRVLMGESKVFKSGLDAHNTYDVKYDGSNRKENSKGDVLCALKRVKVRTITTDDEPFKRLGYQIPKFPLKKGRHYNTCAVVTSAGALLGSRLGDFIGKFFSFRY